MAGLNIAYMLDLIPVIAGYVPLTMFMAVVSMIAALILAAILAVIRVMRVPVLDWIVAVFISFFRGTPLLVQLFLIYYGAGQWQWLKDSAAWVWFSQAWFCAVLAFTLNTGAYTAEIIRGAINAMPKGEIEAAYAFGMSRLTTLRRVILPNSFRRALPAYSNEVIFMLHGSAVAGVITIVDLTGAARIVNSRYYSPFEAFLAAGLLYMCLTFLLVWGFRRLENRWFRHLRPRKV